MTADKPKSHPSNAKDYYSTRVYNGVIKISDAEAAHYREHLNRAFDQMQDRKPK